MCFVQPNTHPLLTTAECPKRLTSLCRSGLGRSLHSSQAEENKGFWLFTESEAIICNVTAAHVVINTIWMGKSILYLLASSNCNIWFSNIFYLIKAPLWQHITNNSESHRCRRQGSPQRNTWPRCWAMCRCACCRRRRAGCHWGARLSGGTAGSCSLSGWTWNTNVANIRENVPHDCATRRRIHKTGQAACVLLLTMCGCSHRSGTNHPPGRTCWQAAPCSRRGRTRYRCWYHTCCCDRILPEERHLWSQAPTTCWTLWTAHEQKMTDKIGGT